MAVMGIGVDVCEIARWRQLAERNPGAVGRILTEAEAGLSVASQAARWAAKEALAKALGAPAGLVWHDCEVVKDAHGAPHFELRGTVATRAAELGIARVHLSISHDAGIASAFVVCEGES